mgnify:CR=1 FL=1
MCCCLVGQLRITSDPTGAFLTISSGLAGAGCGSTDFTFSVDTPTGLTLSVAQDHAALQMTLNTAHTQITIMDLKSAKCSS